MIWFWCHLSFRIFTRHLCSWSSIGICCIFGLFQLCICSFVIFLFCDLFKTPCEAKFSLSAGNCIKIFTLLINYRSVHCRFIKYSFISLYLLYFGFVFIMFIGILFSIDGNATDKVQRLYSFVNLPTLYLPCAFFLVLCWWFSGCKKRLLFSNSFIIVVWYIFFTFKIFRFSLNSMYFLICWYLRNICSIIFLVSCFEFFVMCSYTLRFPKL